MEMLQFLSHACIMSLNFWRGIMKKLLSIAACSFTLFNASCTDADVDVSASEAATCVDTDNFNGINVISGIGGNFFDSSRLMFILGFGGGTTIKMFDKPIYFGAETLLDLTKSRKKSDGSKIGGVIPSIGVRCGYVVECGTMVYGKVALSHASATDKEGKGVGGVSPALSFGAERKFCQKFSARLEAEYRFGTKKHGSKKNSGLSIRALVSYCLPSVSF
jgi:hypothetical protein